MSELTERASCTPRPLAPSDFDAATSKPSSPPDPTPAHKPVQHRHR
ncbi:hypothetical protein AB0B45_44755 [Nonomuraea sp. NPDC049152]